MDGKENKIFTADLRGRPRIKSKPKTGKIRESNEPRPGRASFLYYHFVVLLSWVVFIGGDRRPM